MTPEDPLKSANIETVSAKEVVRESDKIQLILAYLWPLSLIPWLTVKDSEFVRWHGKNGFFLGLIGSVIAILLSFITCGIPILYVPLAAMHIYAMIQALNGERWRIPFISDIAEKV
jgi:uncharacterized membrane protein